MFEKINNCPICDSPSYTNFIICEDYTVSRESFAIVQCNSCGLKYTNPRPSSDVIGKYYESENYISHSNKGNSFVNLVYKYVRKITIRNKLKLIRNLAIPEALKILDVGCGTGEFLRACKSNNWEFAGVELNENARQAAEKITGVSIARELSEIDEKYSVITLWHVLEHLPDLNIVISQLKKLLKKNGKLIIAVPNSDSFDAELFSEHWAAYDVPRHFYHFSQPTMKSLLKNNKLKLSGVVPMKFDSYYVSLLSNKYKYGKNKYLNSFITGLKSNSYASKNKNNYSSLIYIISK